MKIEDLQEKFKNCTSVKISADAGDLPFIHVKNKSASAQICIQGAHVMHYQPEGEKKDILWMCCNSYFEKGKPIRGGIPVCWPWFGPNMDAENLPAHGFARLMFWTLDSIQEPDENCTILHLSLNDNDFSRKLWNYSFHLEIEIQIGKTLAVQLISKNTGDKSFLITEALHSYFNIGNIANVAVKGLESALYLNKVEGANSMIKQKGAITFNAEFDSVFSQCKQPIHIVDTFFNRTITVEKKNSNSTIVWNPWIAKSKRMPDFTPDSYLTMVCVETANVLSDAIKIEPGKEQSMGMIIHL